VLRRRKAAMRGMRMQIRTRFNRRKILWLIRTLVRKCRTILKLQMIRVGTGRRFQARRSGGRV
jgi:hypothetical protein